MFTTSAYACDDGSSPMKLATIKRRDPGPRDVEIEIEFCGVCHSDIHTALFTPAFPATKSSAVSAAWVRMSPGSRRVTASASAASWIAAGNAQAAPRGWSNIAKTA